MVMLVVVILSEVVVREADDNAVEGSLVSISRHDLRGIFYHDDANSSPGL